LLSIAAVKETINAVDSELKGNLEKDLEVSAGKWEGSGIIDKYSILP